MVMQGKLHVYIMQIAIFLKKKDAFLVSGFSSTYVLNKILSITRHLNTLWKNEQVCLRC